MILTQNTDKIKKIIGIMVCIVLLAGIATILAGCQETGPTQIHKDLLEIGEQAKTTNVAAISREYEKKYSEGSAEALLIKGVCKYYGGNLEEAEKILAGVVGSEYSDAAVPIFSRYFLTKTEYDMGGYGDLARAREMVELMSVYSPLKKDIDFLWEVLNSSSTGYEDDLIILDIFEEYLANTKGLDLTGKVQLRGYIASMRYYTDESTLAIRDFYEVLRIIEESGKENLLAGEKIKAYSFIGDINFNYGAYDEAVQYYEACITTPMEDPEVNAKMKYIAYINRSAAYFEMGDYEKALDSADKLEEIIEYLDEDVAKNLKIAQVDMLAQIAVFSGNYDEAERHIADCVATLESIGRDEFLGMYERINFTKAKLLNARGDKEGAVRVLEDIAGKEDSNVTVLGYDYGDLLLELYAETGQLEKYVPQSQAQMAKRKEDLHYLELSYLDLGKYYQQSDRLIEENTKLLNANYTVLVACALIVVVLALTVLLYMASKRANLRDQLTGVGNRKKLEQIIKNIDKQQNQSLGMIMLDIDFFKEYNDKYGHIKGDEALQQVADVLKTSIRERDDVIRYGGEEFLVILQDVELNVARNVCRRIATGMQISAIEHGESEVDTCVTLSMGLCFKSKDTAADAVEMIEKADEALYMAKDAGRNKVEEIIL